MHGAEITSLGMGMSLLDLAVHTFSWGKGTPGCLAPAVCLSHDALADAINLSQIREKNGKAELVLLDHGLYKRITDDFRHVSSQQYYYVYCTCACANQQGPYQEHCSERLDSV